MGVQNPESPRGLLATQLEPAGGNGGVVGLTKGFWEGRGKRKKKAKGGLADFLPLFLSTHRWAAHPGSLVKAPPPNLE